MRHHTHHTFCYKWTYFVCWIWFLSLVNVWPTFVQHEYVSFLRKCYLINYRTKRNLFEIGCIWLVLLIFGSINLNLILNVIAIFRIFSWWFFYNWCCDAVCGLFFSNFDDIFFSISSNFNTNNNNIVRRINSHLRIQPHEYKSIINIFQSTDDYYYTLCDLFLQVLKHVLIVIVVVVAKVHYYYCYSILLFECRLRC